MRLFGISRANDDNFAQPIYKDYKKSGDTRFFPPSVKPEIIENGVKIKLNLDQATKFEELVGQQRKSLVAPYINDMATFEGSNKTYNELTDEEKIDKLSILYEEGYNNAKKLFFEANPTLKPEIDFESKQQKELSKKQNEIFRQSIKYK